MNTMCNKAYLIIYSLADPTMAPRKVKILTIKKTEAVLSWKSIPCPHQNGRILHYLIRYDYVFPSGIMVEMESRTLGNIMRITLTDLRPNTDYSVRVAGVNHAGIGIFSLPLALITQGGEEKASYIWCTVMACLLCHSCSHSRPSNNHCNPLNLQQHNYSLDATTWWKWFSLWC